MLLDISPKIDRAIATVLSDLADLATDSDIEFFVVGAMARGYCHIKCSLATLDE